MVEKNVVEKERTEGVFMKKWFIYYPPEEEETVLRFKEWCKKYAGNRYMSGLNLLLMLVDFQTQITILNHEIAKIKAAMEMAGEETEPELPATMGGNEDG